MAGRAKTVAERGGEARKIAPSSRQALSFRPGSLFRVLGGGGFRRLVTFFDPQAAARASLFRQGPFARHNDCVQGPFARHNDCRKVRLLDITTVGGSDETSRTSRFRILLTHFTNSPSDVVTQTVILRLPPGGILPTLAFALI